MLDTMLESEKKRAKKLKLITPDFDKVESEILSIVKDGKTKLKQIFENTQLSTEGKIKNKAELTEKLEKEMVRIELQFSFESRLSDWEGRLVSARERYEADTFGEDQTLRFLREQAIRDRVEKMNDSGRLQFLWGAEKEEDELALSALFNSPQSFPLVPENEIARAKKDRDERLFPKIIKTLAEYKLCQSILDRMVSFARRAINGEIT